MCIDLRDEIFNKVHSLYYSIFRISYIHLFIINDIYLINNVSHAPPLLDDATYNEWQNKH